MKTSRTDQGFTLIEVMIAMTLMSFMMVLLVSSLSTSAESWERGERKIDQVNENAVVHHFFQRYLSTAKPLSKNNEAGETRFSFQGSSDSLQFVTGFPASASRKGLQLFEVKWSGRDQARIQVTLSPYFSDMDEQTLVREEVTLITQVTGLNINYFVRETANEDGTWEDSWQEKQFMPQLVKIKIELKDNRYWPEFVIPLKINSAAVFMINREEDDTDLEEDDTDPELGL
ncbi:MAG: prepilin-type N-terminal cleavage/methylation domain-containing protein [Gammaproteobacteria bacterium]